MARAAPILPLYRPTTKVIASSCSLFLSSATPPKRRILPSISPSLSPQERTDGLSLLVCWIPSFMATTQLLPAGFDTKLSLTHPLGATWWANWAPSLLLTVYWVVWCLYTLSHPHTKTIPPAKYQVPAPKYGDPWTVQTKGCQFFFIWTKQCIFPRLVLTNSQTVLPEIKKGKKNQSGADT